MLVIPTVIVMLSGANNSKAMGLLPIALTNLFIKYIFWLKISLLDYAH